MLNHRFAACITVLTVFAAVSVCLGEADVDTIRHSVVRIQATTLTPDYRVPWNPGRMNRGTGSGFVVAGNLIMTNAHVVSNARFLGIEKHGNPNIFPARVKFIAHDCDLALLEVDTPGFFKDLVPLDLGDIPPLHSSVDAYGYPIGGKRLSVTRGVVSRMEFRPYAHSGLDSHLSIQIDAAINPGNSGGPVIQDGRVVGVVFQGFQGSVAQNTGYMIPTPIINRFLADIKDGTYDGYVDLAIRTYNLLTPVTRTAYGLADDNRGILVTWVMTAGSCHGVLQRDDVLLAIDGHPILSDSHILLDGDYVLMEEIVERKFAGDTVRFSIKRGTEVMEKDVILRDANPIRMMARNYDQLPRFILFAGMLFQPLETDLLSAYGTGNPEIMDHFAFFITEEIYRDRPELVVLSSILSDPINTHLDRFDMSIVDTVNDQRIGGLKDLDDALSKPADRYVFRLIGHAMPIVIEAERLAEATTRIARQYRVTQSKRVDNEEQSDD